MIGGLAVMMDDLRGSQDPRARFTTLHICNFLRTHIA